MHRYFVTAEPQEPIAAVHQTMRLARLRHLLVTADGRLLGIASYRDVVEAVLEHATRRLRFAIAHPVDLDAGTLQSVMAPLPVVVHPSTPLAVAAEQLCRHRFGCLPVVEETGGELPLLVGVITETDLLRAAFANGSGGRPRRRSAPRPS